MPLTLYRDPRYRQLGWRAARLHYDAHLFTNDLETDGKATNHDVDMLAAAARIDHVADAVKQLIAAGFWRKDGPNFILNDFLGIDHVVRETTRQEWRRQKDSQRHPHVRPNVPDSVPDKTPDRSPREVRGKRKREGGESSPLTTFVGPQSAANGELALTSQLEGVDRVQQVFDAWCQGTRRTARTRLDDKRRRLILRALESYPLEDVLDAVVGWKNSPHHRGENENATVYNDLELLLRDSRHIEKFRDLQRGNGQRNGRAPIADTRAYDLWEKQGAEL